MAASARTRSSRVVRDHGWAPVANGERASASITSAGVSVSSSHDPQRDRARLLFGAGGEDDLLEDGHVIHRLGREPPCRRIYTDPRHTWCRSQSMARSRPVGLRSVPRPPPRRRASRRPGPEAARPGAPGGRARPCRDPAARRRDTTAVKKTTPRPIVTAGLRSSVRGVRRCHSNSANSPDSPRSSRRPPRERWRELAAEVLRKSGWQGSADDVEQALSTTTYDGVTVAPLHDASDLPRAPRIVGRTGGWDVRQRHADPDPAATRAAILADLENGVTSIWLVLGDSGTRPRCPDVLDGVYLDLAPVVLDAGAEPRPPRASCCACCRGRRDGRGRQPRRRPARACARTGAGADPAARRRPSSPGAAPRLPRAAGAHRRRAAVPRGRRLAPPRSWAARSPPASPTCGS